MDYLYLALKFIIGGSVIVGVTVLAEHVDPKYGGLLAAAPIITTLAILFTSTDVGQDIARQLAIDSFWFVIPTMLFLLTLYFLMGRYPLAPSLGGALLVWAAGACAMYRTLVPV
jgi:uncharacterized membrane protein (GlpM family)